MTAKMNRYPALPHGQGYTLTNHIHFQHRDVHLLLNGYYSMLVTDEIVSQLADMYKVELPITDVVRSVVWEGADAATVTRALQSRPLTTEFWGLA